jgi:hypothetical protein
MLRHPPTPTGRDYSALLGAFSSEVDAGLREENASKQK